jgi:multicomponent K+:H+ antiporter subunit G
VGALVLASMVHFSARNDVFAFRELAVILFLFITAPVSAHMISKAALKKTGAEPATDRSRSESGAP